MQNEGCKTIGIAGGPEKCSFIKDEMELDHAIDYKSGNLSEGLAEACPNGIDIYFENVGGEVSNAVAPLMNQGGRVPICGYISACRLILIWIVEMIYLKHHLMFSEL